MFLLAGAPAVAASAAKEFLLFVYGADNIDVAKVCWPSDDLWMLRGARNPAGIAELESEKIAHGQNEVVIETIHHGLCMLEVRNGRVDPAFSLEQVYTRHRQMVLRFIYASLTQDRDTLKDLATKPQNVKFGRAKAPPMGDLDQYQEVVGMIPVVRVSSPTADKESKSVTYRVPLGSKGFNVRLVKNGSQWQIDTNSTVNVPLDFFFR